MPDSPTARRALFRAAFTAGCQQKALVLDLERQLEAARDCPESDDLAARLAAARTELARLTDAARNLMTTTTRGRHR